MSILLPVFASASERARTAACTSNLQQIGNALQMYIQDNDGYYLPWGQTNSLVGASTPELRLQAYVKSKEVWVCPDETNTTARKMTNTCYVSYQLNDGEDDSTGHTIDYIAGCRESKFDEPSELVATMDSDAGEDGWTEGNTWDGGLTTDWPIYEPNGCWDSNARQIDKPCGSESWNQTWFLRHNNMMNILFMDGHVKSYSPQSGYLTAANFVPAH